MHRKLLAVLMLALALLISVSSVALGQNDTEDAALRQYGGNGDDLPHPLGKQQRGLRQIALQQQLQGAQATQGSMRVGR